MIYLLKHCKTILSRWAGTFTNLLLLNAASGSEIEQVLEKMVDFGMDVGKDIFVAILIYLIGRFIIKQIVY